MRWRIAVTTIEGDERLLRDILAEFHISIMEDGAARYLVSERFDVHDTPQGAREDAEGIRAVLDRVSSEEPDSKATFTVGNVFEKKADGFWREHLFTDIGLASLAITAKVGVMGTISVTTSASDEDRKRIEEENKEREYQRRRRVAVSRVVSAYRDERCLQVQRLLRGELTPLALGHIYEIIESDVGGGMTDFASRNQQSRFTRSINHPEVFGGQARHGVSKSDPPPKPMNLDEARNFIRDVAARWMDRKAGI